MDVFLGSAAVAGAEETASLAGWGGVGYFGRGLEGGGEGGCEGVGFWGCGEAWVDCVEADAALAGWVGCSFAFAGVGCVSYVGV